MPEEEVYEPGSSMQKPEVKEAYNPNVEPATATPLGAQVQGLNWSIKNHSGDRVTHVGNADEETDEYVAGRALFINKAIQEDPTVLETLTSAFQTENTFGSMFSEVDTQTNYIQPGYDSVEDPQLEPYLDDTDMMFRASLSFNPQNTSDVVSNVLRERENRRIQAEAGGMGMALTMAVAMLDPVYLPVYLFPQAQAARFGRVSYLVADAAIGTAVSEAILHDTQQLRTAEETAMNMTAAILMSYGLGKAVNYLDTKQIKRLAEDQVAMTKASEVQGAKLDMTPEQVAAGNAAEHKSVGAMAVDEGNVTALVPDDYLPVGANNKVMEAAIRSSMAPNAQMSMSASLQTRKYNALWGQQSILYKGNMEGRGIAADGGAIESRIAVQHGAAQIVAESVEDAFWAYRGMEQSSKIAKAKSALGDITGIGKDPNVMNLDEFNKAVFWAMDSNSEHASAEVNKAAKKVREYFTDMEKEGVKVKLLDPDRLPDEKRYLSRKWKHDEIVRKQPQVEKAFTDFFLMRRNMLRDDLGTSPRMEQLNLDIETLQAAIKVEPGLEKSRELSAMIAKRQGIMDESGGFKELDDALVVRDDAVQVRDTAIEKAESIEANKKVVNDDIEVKDKVEKKALGKIDKDRDAVNKDIDSFVKERETASKKYQATKEDLRKAVKSEKIVADNTARIEKTKVKIAGVEKRILTNRRKQTKYAEKPEMLAKAKVEATSLRERKATLNKEIRDSEKLIKNNQERAGNVKSLTRDTRNYEVIRDSKSRSLDHRRGKLGELDKKRADFVKASPIPKLRQKIKELNADLDKAKVERANARADVSNANAKYKILKDEVDQVLPFMNKTSAQLKELSREAVQNITSSASGMNNNILPEGIVLRAGSFKERSLDIPNSMIKDLDIVEDNITQVIRGYTKSVSPQIETARSFDGDIQAQKMFDDINNNWNILDDDMRLTAKKESWSPERLKKENVKAAKARKQDIDNARTIRDRVMGNHDANFDAQSVGNRLIRGLKQTAFLSKLGGMTISAIPDLSRAVTTYGFMPVVKMMKSLATDPNVRMMTKMENKRAGVVLETFINQRMNRIADLTEDVVGSTKFEKAMGYAADNYGKVTGMVYWNNALKDFAGIMAQDSIMRSINKMASGQKLSKLEARVLGQTGLNPKMQNRIAKQLQHAEEAEGVWVAKTTSWTDEEAVRSFRSALKQMSDQVIVTPGAGDIPKFIGHGTSSLIFQFKSFILTSHQKMLISGLQQRDQALLSGLLMSGALGAAVHGIKTYQATGELPQVDNAGDFIHQSLDRTGYYGYFGEFMQLAPKLTGGRLNVNKLWGGEQQTYNRYAARDAVGSVLGPSLGTVSEGLRVARALGSGEVSEGDVKAFRRNIWYQNHFMFRELFDVIQDQAVDKFATE